MLPKKCFLYFDDVDNVDDDYHYQLSIIIIVITVLIILTNITSTGGLCLFNNRSLQRSASIYQFSKHT